MIREGVKFKRAWHLTWRNSNPWTDRYAGDFPEPIMMNHVVIISRNTQKPIPLTEHPRTNMAYGKWRSGYAKYGETCAVYWVEDGCVYSGTIRGDEK